MIAGFVCASDDDDFGLRWGKDWGNVGTGFGGILGFVDGDGGDVRGIWDFIGGFWGIVYDGVGRIGDVVEVGGIWVGGDVGVRVGRVEDFLKDVEVFFGFFWGFFFVFWVDLVIVGINDVVVVNFIIVIIIIENIVIFFFV